MASCETLHRKFLNTSTSGFTLLKSFNPSCEDDPLKSIHQLVDIYLGSLWQNTADDGLNDAFHKVLCYQYRLLVENKIDATSDYNNENLFENLRGSLFHAANDDNNGILNQISVLQIILYLDIEDISELFTEAIEFINTQIYDWRNRPIVFLPIAILVDAWILRKRSKSDDIPGDIMTIGLLLDEIDNWFRIINEIEWSSFISIITKLTSKTDSPEAICSFLWDLILGNITKGRTERSLELLCELIGDLFSKSSGEIVSMNINSCLNQDILISISQYLISEDQSRRQKAQYALRRIVEYLKNHSQNIPIEEADKKLKPPFIFCKDDNSEIEELERNYFLLLESLEQNQTHLVLPSMSHLDNLVRLTASEELCFNRTWLRCLFSRLLSYGDPLDNRCIWRSDHKEKKYNTVIKAGLIALLRMDLQLFDNAFIKLLLEILNNKFIYEDSSADLHPWILKELSNLFIKAEQSGINITSKIIIQASSIRWSPISLFYVFEVLGNIEEMAEVEYNVWATEELHALRTLTWGCTMEMMRIPTQKNILKCFMTYVKPPQNLWLMGGLLTNIVRDGALKRGDNNWKLLTDYLKKNTKESDAIKFISKCSDRLEEIRYVGDIKASAILIVLMLDTENMSFRASITSKILCKLFMPFNDAFVKSHPHYSLLGEALTTMSGLMKLSPRADDTYTMLISTFSQSLFNFLMSSFMSDPLDSRSHKDLKIHVEALSTIFDVQSSSPTYAGFIINKYDVGDEKLESMVQSILSKKADVLRSWYGLNILSFSSRGCDFIFKQPLPKFSFYDRRDEVVPECHGVLARIYHRCVKRNEELSEEFVHKIMEELQALAELKSEYAYVGISATLREISMKVKFRGDDKVIHNCIKDILNVYWKDVLWSMAEKREFRLAAKELIELVLGDSFIKVEHFKTIALNIVDDIICRTDNTSPLRYILFTRMKAMETNAETADKRIEMHTCRYTTKEHHELNFWGETLQLGVGVCMDEIIRALLVTLIVKMNETCKELSKAYVPRLISICEKQKNERYVADSNVHRLKLRIMQVLLLLRLSFTSDDAVKIHDILIKSILTENNQSSVRIMGEWNLICLCHRSVPMQDLVWDLSSSARADCPEILPSLMSIVYHVASTLPECDQLQYIKKAIQNILPSCFSQQSTVQLYAQAVLSKLFEMIDKISPEESNEYKIIREIAQKNLQYGDLRINSIKLINNFYFSIFNPRDSYSLQTIFHELPRLTNVSVDGWIRPEIFELFSPRENQISGIDIYNNDTALSDIETLSVMDEPDEIADSDRTQMDTSEKTTTERQELITSNPGLIVIASLISWYDRTLSDTFCAQQLRVNHGDEGYGGDWAYNLESLRITAEKWIIDDVKPHELRDYLLEKKSMGWKLVGVKQKKWSSGCRDRNFNEKTVLLLGHHKNGIPADLIQLMDTCLEIPLMGTWFSSIMSEDAQRPHWRNVSHWTSTLRSRGPESCLEDVMSQWIESNDVTKWSNK